MKFVEKLILHVDMDAFFAAVEQNDNPELIGKPVVIGSAPDQRGVVSTCSYEARKFGIHSAMPSRTAYQRCKHAIFLPGRMARYKEVSREIMKIFDSFTPFVEPLSIDEAFLDVTGSQRLMGDGLTIAKALKQSVKEQTGLSCSVGVAPNKFLAKIASDLNKPDGLTLVPFDADQIIKFLAPLPVKRMWGVGPKTLAILQKNGIRTFADLQNSSESNLRRILGDKAANSFYNLSFGRDSRDIELGQPEKSISNELTFKEDISSQTEIRRNLLNLVDKVGGRLRAENLYANTVHLKVRWSDFQTITRQKSLSFSICDDRSLRDVALELLNNITIVSPIRLIGFGVSKFSEKPIIKSVAQLDLFSESKPEPQKNNDRQEKLSFTVDQIRKKLGKDIIKRGSSMDFEK